MTTKGEKAHLLWSPHEADVFAMGSGDQLKLYRFSEAHARGNSVGAQEHHSMQLIGAITDVQQLKCISWCPHATSPWTFAIGTASGRVVLHDCTPEGAKPHQSSLKRLRSVVDLVKFTGLATRHKHGLPRHSPGEYFRRRRVSATIVCPRVASREHTSRRWPRRRSTARNASPLRA